MNKKEIVAFLVSVIVLTLVFGFEDSSTTFDLSHWLFNLVKVFVIVLICLGFYIGLQKYIAKTRDAETVYNLWTLSRFKLKDYNRGKRPNIPVGILIAMFVMFISMGKFFFTGLGTSEINWDKSRRTGRRFVNIGEYESALIYLGGPLALSIILFVCNWLSLYNINLDLLYRVSFYMLVFSILPIPGLDGAKILTSSRVAYIFFVVFISLNLILTGTSIIFALLLSAVMALIVVGLYYYKWEK